MTQSDSESLAALEHLMEEFFHHSTSNQRKQDIEGQLNSFSSQRESWKPCIYFITHSSSQYVSMYSLSTIESVISRQWTTLNWEHRVQLKSALYNFFIEQDNNAPNFIRNKLAKLVVDIARFDWPHFYPEFFNNILQLLQSDNAQLLGLILLRTTSEELMSPRPDLNSWRKEELTKLLQQYIPQVFPILSNILESLGNKPRHNATATPPPSPTHPSSAPNLVQHISAASFRSDGKAVTREALATLQHMFTWTPLPEVPARLVSAIFNFTNISSYAQDDDDMCVLAMSTLNELLYRKCAPQGSQGLFKQLYYHTVHLLQDISCPSTGKLETLGQDFIEKLSELLSLLIEQHLWRLESEPGFSALDFLSLLYQLTMQLPSIQCYLLCLSVWSVFIKQIKPQNAQKYSEALLGLLTSILNKLQFSCNFAQLDELDNEHPDEHNETEWHIFVKTSIELIALIAEFAPVETLNSVLHPWRVAHDLYTSLEHRVTTTTSHPSLHLHLDPGDLPRIHGVLRDLASLTQTLGRLAVVLHTDDDGEVENGGDGGGGQEMRNGQGGGGEATAYMIRTLADKLGQSACVAGRVRFDRAVVEREVAQDFIDVHSQFLAALKTLTLHLHQTSHLSPSTTTPHHLSPHYLSLLLTAILPLLSPSSNNLPPLTITLPAAHLLLTLTGTTHPPSHFLPHQQQLLLLATAVGGANKQQQQQQSQQSQQLQQQQLQQLQHVDCLVSSAVCAWLVRPWMSSGSNTGLAPGLSESSDTRLALQAGFWNELCGQWLGLDLSSGVERVRLVSAGVLRGVAAVLEYCREYPAQSKRQLHQGLKGTIDHALHLFPTYSRHAEIADHMLSFFLTVLGVLQQQIGIQCTTRIVQVILEVAVSEQQSKNLTSLDKLLQILQIVVESPGSSYKSFLPSILQLCMQNVYPSVICQANEHPDVIVALLTLLHSILLHRWNYFYLSQVRLGYSPGCSENDLAPDSPQQPQQLYAVLQVFGQSLLQPDINTFKTSLGALENLNSKWKLYSKTLFKEQLLSQFLTVLLQSLLNKSHSLLMEDISQAVYNMALVDLNGFFSNFLVDFIQKMEGLDQSQKDVIQGLFTKDSDMPTFIQNLQRFTNDMRCYKICNASLPPGSVVL